MIKHSLTIVFYCLLVTIAGPAKTFGMLRSAALPEDRARH